MFTSQIVQELKQKLSETVSETQEELMAIRTGKASPALVENIVVATYGGTTKLRILELATVSITSASQLLISPFDPLTVQDIERAIHSSPLHLTPRVEGKMIRIDIPPLSQEQRHDYIRLAASTAESGREKIRSLRDEVRKKIKSESESKNLTEDDRFRLEKEVDNATQEYTKMVDAAREKKEKEIMEV